MDQTPSARSVPEGQRPSVSASRPPRANHSRETANSVQISESQLQAGADRVFVTHPRIFSFSHRSLLSLRHPYCAVSVMNCDHEPTSRIKRTWQTRTDRLTDSFNELAPTHKYEVERWSQVSYMVDTVLFDRDANHRRMQVLEAVTVRRALESWWCRCGGSPNKGITELSYKQTHERIYAFLLGSTDPALTAVVNSGIDRDWHVDSQGTGYVDYGSFVISVLEIADNWTPSVDADQYASFLRKLYNATQPLPTLVTDSFDGSTIRSSGDGGAVAAAQEQEHPVTWDDTVRSLRRVAQEHAKKSVIRTKRSALQTVVYEQCDVEGAPVSM